MTALEAAPPAYLQYRGWRRHAKRGMDLGLILLTLPVTFPLMTLIAVGVKLTSRGPVFFRQERVGQHAGTFSMLKFRTMYIDSEERLQADPQLRDEFLHNDFKLPIEKDPRVVPFGRFLRQCSLDELPQIVNVVSGKMSLVGPRPIFEGQVEAYGPLAWAYFEAKPGLTGEWQTSGRNDVHFPERAQLDAHYVENWTLHRDAAILLKTIPCVLRRDGAA